MFNFLIAVSLFPSLNANVASVSQLVSK